MTNISNKFLTVTAKTKGAELDSIFHNELKQEYLWNADANYWGKKSPVLFPIVGALKNNTYHFDENEYQLNRHGFARDMEFELESSTDKEMTFLLESNDETKKIFPFDFEFRVTYSLQRNALHVAYDVKNTGADEMFFSVGAHPAFKLPMADETSYSDYYLEFEMNETAKRHLLNENGLLDGSEDFLRDTNRINLSKELFHRDAIVLKQLQSGMVSLLSEKTERGLNFYFDGFPSLGLWAAKDADFICIEPWCGVSDSVRSNGNLVSKEGINCLKAGRSFRVVWSVECF